jgi:hypothetical protein
MKLRTVLRVGLNEKWREGDRRLDDLVRAERCAARRRVSHGGLDRAASSIRKEICGATWCLVGPNGTRSVQGGKKKKALREADGLPGQLTVTRSGWFEVGTKVA